MEGGFFPSLAIILVFSTSKGFPAIDPKAPAKDPAVNLNTKLESLVTPIACLIGPYKPKRRDVYEASLSQAALIPFQKAAMPSSAAITLTVPLMPRAL